MVKIGNIHVKRAAWQYMAPRHHVVVRENGQERLATFVFSATSVDREVYTYRRDS